MILRPRSYFGWGGSGASYADPTRGLVIHYNGPATNLRSHSDCIAYWKRVRRDHMRGNGWADLGYSWGACRHGEVFTGRGLRRYQAAQGTTRGNSEWYSVTLMLGGNEQPTQGHIQAVRDLRAYLMARGVGGAIRGHRSFVSTSCPGDVLYELVLDGTFGARGNGNPSSGGGGGMTSVRSIRSQQTAVNGLGHNPKLDIDGLWGPKTEAGVKWLQGKVGVTADGLWGPATEAAYRAAGGDAPIQVKTKIPPFPLPRGWYFGPRSGPAASVSGYYSHRSDLRRWQKQMLVRGWSIDADGLYGPQTARIAEQFQREKRLGVDALIGPATWAAAWTAPIT
ncbi:N-acetylmuramoyl-L-alanine amidase [Nocardiopsis sp. FR4]|uniref:peptidoglycan recognition protein family protein n=1 Tax=Nocardiopsis sp. FR4 TaxID=2605985 RepID=UPI001F30CAC2|nr:N-acetylmuramoyl-L-alanine amidase [Nocardiopsis sp. FR4]